jgi:predicted DNA-binding protein
MRAKKPLAVTAFRLAAEMLKRLDRHARRMERRNPGLRLTRGDAVRELLTRGLDEAEAAERDEGKG